MGRRAGFRHSEEHKERLRAASRAAWADPETRERMAEGTRRWVASGARKRPTSPEFRRRMSEVMTAACRCPDFLARRNAAARRGFARRAARLAGLPLTKANVDQVRALMDAGMTGAEACEALRSRKAGDAR